MGKIKSKLHMNQKINLLAILGASALGQAAATLIKSS